MMGAGCAVSRGHIRALSQQAQAWRSDASGSRAAVADLVELARGGNSMAMGEVMEIHAPLVRSLCWQIRVRQADIADFVQDGLIALRGPVERYDRLRGVPLWGYARPCVRGCLVTALGAQIGLKSYQAKHYRRVWDAHTSLEADGHEATAELIRTALRTAGRA